MECRIDPDSRLRVAGNGSTSLFFCASVTDNTDLPSPGSTIQDADGQRLLSLDRASATRLSLAPLPVAELVLRRWSTGAGWPRRTTLCDPVGREPTRVRAGSVVVDGEGSVLLIERNGPNRRWYEIPGGGVEAQETPRAAALRELREETGLTGIVDRKLATVYKEGRKEHYFLMRSQGVIGDRAALDLRPDARLVWLPAMALANLPLWPKRLAWRIAAWANTAWPDAPVDLSDSIADSDLPGPCDW